LERVKICKRWLAAASPASRLPDTGTTNASVNAWFVQFVSAYKFEGYNPARSGAIAVRHERKTKSTPGCVNVTVAGFVLRFQFAQTDIYKQACTHTGTLQSRKKRPQMHPHMQRSYAY